MATLQQKTIFSYPFLVKFVGAVARGFFVCTGWQFTRGQPKPSKYVMIVAPHTSNWDFFLMVVVAAGLGRQVRFMGKHSLFSGLQGRVLRWLGGVAVQRNSHHNFVSQMVSLYEQTDDMVLIIAPEGTRRKVTAWKRGFYYIAAGAGVPIVAAQLDYAKKGVDIATEFYVSGDYDADLAQIQLIYRDVTAKYPEQNCSYPNSPENKL